MAPSTPRHGVKFSPASSVPDDHIPRKRSHPSSVSGDMYHLFPNQCPPGSPAFPSMPRASEYTNDMGIDAAEKILQIHFSPNGKHAVGGSRQGFFCVWDLSNVGNRTLLPEIVVRGIHPVFNCWISNSGSEVITSCGDGMIRIWDREGGIMRARGPFGGKFRNSRGCVISGDGRWAVASFFSGYRTRKSYNAPEGLSRFSAHIKFIDVVRNKILFQMDQYGKVDTCAISRSGNVIAIGLSGVQPAPTMARLNDIVLVNRWGDVLARLKDVVRSSSICSAWDLAESGEKIVTSEGNHVELYESGAAGKWDAPPMVFGSGKGEVSLVRFAENDTRIIAVRGDQSQRKWSVQVFSVRTRELLLEFSDVLSACIPLSLDAATIERSKGRTDEFEVRSICRDFTDIQRISLVTSVVSKPTQKPAFANPSFDNDSPTQRITYRPATPSRFREDKGINESYRERDMSRPPGKDYNSTFGYRHEAEEDDRHIRIKRPRVDADRPRTPTREFERGDLQRSSRSNQPMDRPKSPNVRFSSPKAMNERYPRPRTPVPPASPYRNSRPQSPYRAPRPPSPFFARPSSSLPLERPSSPFVNRRPSSPFRSNRPSSPFISNRPSSPFPGNRPSSPFPGNRMSSPFPSQRPSSPYCAPRPSAPARQRPSYNSSGTRSAETNGPGSQASSEGAALKTTRSDGKQVYPVLSTPVEDVRVASPVAHRPRVVSGTTVNEWAEAVNARSPRAVSKDLNAHNEQGKGSSTHFEAKGQNADSFRAGEGAQVDQRVESSKKSGLESENQQAEAKLATYETSSRAHNTASPQKADESDTGNDSAAGISHQAEKAVDGSPAAKPSNVICNPNDPNRRSAPSNTNKADGSEPNAGRKMKTVSASKRSKAPRTSRRKKIIDSSEDDYSIMDLWRKEKRKGRSTEKNTASGGGRIEAKQLGSCGNTADGLSKQGDGCEKEAASDDRKSSLKDSVNPLGSVPSAVPSENTVKTRSMKKAEDASLKRRDSHVQMASIASGSNASPATDSSVLSSKQAPPIRCHYDPLFPEEDVVEKPVGTQKVAEQVVKNEEVIVIPDDDDDEENAVKHENMAQEDGGAAECKAKEENPSVASSLSAESVENLEARAISFFRERADKEHSGSQYMTNTKAFREIVWLLGYEGKWLEERDIGRIIYKKVGTSNMCTEVLFGEICTDLVRQLHTRRRDILEQTFAEAAVEGEDSLLVYHATDVLKECLERMKLPGPPGWCDTRMSQMFESTASGMLVSRSDFVQAAERILTASPERSEIKLEG